MIHKHRWPQTEEKKISDKSPKSRICETFGKVETLYHLLHAGVDSYFYADEERMVPDREEVVRKNKRFTYFMVSYMLLFFVTLYIIQETLPHGILSTPLFSMFNVEIIGWYIVFMIGAISVCYVFDRSWKIFRLFATKVV
jgi:uncharacterized membrane protein (DUF485 family)